MELSVTSKITPFEARRRLETSQPVLPSVSFSSVAIYSGQSKREAELLAQNMALQESVKALTETVKRQQEQINALTRNLEKSISRFDAKSI
jgi:hypothetical protein